MSTTASMASTANPGSMPDALHRRATRKAFLNLIPLMCAIYFMSFLDRTNVALAKIHLAADVGISAELARVICYCAKSLDPSIAEIDKGGDRIGQFAVGIAHLHLTQPPGTGFVQRVQLEAAELPDAEGEVIGDDVERR